MGYLNLLESAILNAIISENELILPSFRKHLEYLTVNKRIVTGVGLYVDFEDNYPFYSQNTDYLLSSQKELYFDSLSNEVSYVLDITNGKIKNLEIVTNGSDVLNDDINLSNFKLV